MTTPADVKQYANLADEVPDNVLQEHINHAMRKVYADTGTQSTADNADDYSLAVTLATLITVYPWLNSFYLDGAARAGRLEGTLDSRFMSPDEVDAHIERLQQQYELVSTALANADADSDVTSSVSTPGLFMAAIPNRKQ